MLEGYFMWQILSQSRLVGRYARTPEVLSLLGLCSAACMGVALLGGAIMCALPCNRHVPAISAELWHASCQAMGTGRAQVGLYEYGAEVAKAQPDK